MKLKKTDRLTEQNQSLDTSTNGQKTDVESTTFRTISKRHKAWADEYQKTESVEAASNATGYSAAQGYKIKNRPEVQAYLERIAQRGQISKADVITRAAELLDIALCRRPWRTDDDGTKQYLKAPNLAIAERLVGRLGDAVGLWAKVDQSAPAPGSVNIGTLITDGSGSLADRLIARIPTVEHTPQVEDEG